MDNDKLPTFLGFAIIPELVKLICKKDELNEIAAAVQLYTSEVYALLEQEETKLWHYGALTLYDMLKSELETGKIAFPEGI